jgi:hypothetical protein
MAKTPKTEDEKRADEVLQRMLNTPPKPRIKDRSSNESPKRDSLASDKKGRQS